MDYCIDSFESKNAVKGTPGERTRSKCPIAIHQCTRIQRIHTRQTYHGHFFCSLKATCFDAVKAWLPCRPGRCDKWNCDNRHLIGRLRREASKVSRRGQACTATSWIGVEFFAQLIGHTETLRHHASFQPTSIAEEKPFPLANHTNDDGNYSKELVTETEYHRQV